MLIKNNKINKLLISVLLTFLFYKNNISKIFFLNSPLVSIIIPVSNSFNYTYKCINSILNADSSFYYEIIIIDETLNNKIKLLIEMYKQNQSNNTIYYKTKKYKNYIENCNQAVRLSNGKYIAFLRDNTKVYKNWLTYLLKTIENDKKIGLVGSKLIYSNGILEEAGGIVWNNGEYSNYGRGSDANLPEFNYIKEVDFISGISFIIRKSIWNKIGGFDERYDQIYYQFINIAFLLRNNGYKIIYQPKSLVKHYTQISIWNNNLSFIQEIDKKKFLEEWKYKLKYQLSVNNTFLARDRSINRSRILVIDRYVPNFDKDAGGRCCFMYLNIFNEIGLKVTFLGDYVGKIEPYTSILQQKGIEVLYGNSYKNKKLEIWLKENIKYFNYIYLQRPDISIKYIDFIKKYSSGKIFYFAHDLHYIRLLREFNITKKIKYYIKSRYMEKIEREIFNKVDIIHIVGSYEYKILKDEYKNKTIRNIPLYIYEEPLKNIEKNFHKRKDLIFVGGFEHSANVDAIIWFAKEIYPKIIKIFPNIILHIISSKISKKISQLESKNIKIEGFMSDEDLHSMYQKCRIAIAPLRYGAGVKGKVIEAAYNQIPMVTTTIGGEGIDNSIGTFIMEDNPEKMAEIISRLYVDYSKLKQMSDSGLKLIEKYFSKSYAKKVILNDIKL